VEGGVGLSTALDVLQRFGVTVVVHPGGRYTLSRDNLVPETKRFPALLGRKMIGYLSEKYGVPVHLFWHPEQVDEYKAAQATGSKRADPN
jgi:hypothetical protein